jgi:hypothetical protein
MGKRKKKKKKRIGDWGKGGGKWVVLGDGGVESRNEGEKKSSKSKIK